MSTRSVTRMFTSALILITAVAGLAAADPQGPRADGDRDDARATFKAKRGEHRAAKLALFDADKDGALSDAERDRMHEARATAAFAALDTNRDGRLTIDEFKAGRAKRHARGGHRERGEHHGQRGEHRGQRGEHRGQR